MAHFISVLFLIKAVELENLLFKVSDINMCLLFLYVSLDEFLALW